MNNQLSINIFLTEKFLGKCWHTPEVVGYTDILEFEIKECSKCHVRTGCNSDLFTPTGFFLLWEKAQKEEWFQSFEIYCHKNWMIKCKPNSNYLVWLINPLTFPTLLAEYLGWKELT